MIRPATCITAALAFGSGLYLYQTKHQAQVLDKQIEHTVKAAAAARTQTRDLAATWSLLGNPARLQQLSVQFLDIKPIALGQFVSMAELDTRLAGLRSTDTPATATASAAPAVIRIVCRDLNLHSSYWTVLPATSFWPLPLA